MRKINLFEYKKLKDTEINDLCRRAESDLSDYYPKVDKISYIIMMSTIM